MSRNPPPVLSTRALPATVTDLLNQRVVTQKPRLLDEVDAVYVALYDDPKFKALRGEIDPEETVEGSIQDDDTVAAEMIRTKGDQMGLKLVASSQLHDIRIKMRAVERRFNASRAQRAKAQAPVETAEG